MYCPFLCCKQGKVRRTSEINARPTRRGSSSSRCATFIVTDVLIVEESKRAAYAHGQIINGPREHDHRSAWSEASAAVTSTRPDAEARLSSCFHLWRFGLVYSIMTLARSAILIAIPRLLASRALRVLKPTMFDNDTTDVAPLSVVRYANEERTCILK